MSGVVSVISFLTTDFGLMSAVQLHGLSSWRCV